MTSLVSALCFDAVGRVLETGEAIFYLYIAPTTVRLRAQGEDVDLGTAVCDLVAFPRRPFLEALVACGERFIALAETPWGDDPDNTVIFASLKASTTAARAKLAATFGAG